MTTTIGADLLLAGTGRFLVESLRINPPVLAGLTQPQALSLGMVLPAAGLLAVTAAPPRPPATVGPSVATPVPGETSASLATGHDGAPAELDGAALR